MYFWGLKYLLLDVEVGCLVIFFSIFWKDIIFLENKGILFFINVMDILYFL